MLEISKQKEMWQALCFAWKRQDEINKQNAKDDLRDKSLLIRMKDASEERKKKLPEINPFSSEMWRCVGFLFYLGHISSENVWLLNWLRKPHLEN